MRIKSLFTLLGILVSLLCSAQLVTYKWPTKDGQATLSDKYKVFVQLGDNQEQELEVLMSNAIYEGDYRADELKGRTFSFAQVSYQPKNDKIQFRIEKIFGNPANQIKLSPKSYHLKANLDEAGKTLTFDIDTNNQYLSVNFITSDNQTPNTKWIKHMLCIYIDPLETETPDTIENNVVVYNNSLDDNLLKNAKTIYFEPGYYNLRDYKNGGIIDANGQLILQDKQQIYLAGGAFVEGIIGRQDYNNSNQKIYGRGILSGRQYLWVGNPNHSGPLFGQIVEIGNNSEVNGITIMESPNHGIVGRKVTIQNLKFMGWHCNNDGIRVVNGSEVFNSFLRSVDDHFYNFEIHVHDCVLWAGHNGSIMTFGWGGTGGNTYNAGGSIIENVDIINCEWTGLGNNNGLIMSQTGHDFAPRKETIIRNIRIEGSIPGLTNLKPRTSGNGEITAVKVASNKVGYLGDLIMENITVENQFSKGLIKGTVNASLDDPTTYLVKNVELNNIIIGGKQLSVNNYQDYINVDNKTISNITIDGDTIPSEYYVPELAAAIKVEAEDFSEMSGIQAENTSDQGGGENIGFIQNGDWASYEVSFPETGTYRLSFRVATGGTGGTIFFSIDNENMAEVEVPVNESNGWQDWYTTKYVEVNVSEGVHKIKLEFLGENGFLFNLNWINFELYNTTSVQPISKSSIQFYPNPVQDFMVIKNITSTAELKIFNSLGQEELNQQISKTKCTIELNQLEQGLYLAIVKQNDKKWYFRFMKN